MTMHLTDTSEQFLVDIGAGIRSARRLAALVDDTNTPHSPAVKDRGFVEITLTDPTGSRYGMILAVAEDHQGWNLRADPSRQTITVYVETGALAASITAAGDLMASLATDPVFASFTVTAVPVSETTAETPF